MNEKLNMRPGLANELFKALERSGLWTDELVKQACAGDFMEKVAHAVYGDADIVRKNYEIDCDAPPFIPDERRMKVWTHEKNGKILWDRHAEICRSGYWSRYNANVLDFLLANQQLLKGNESSTWTAFKGTVYQYTDGGLLHRGLHYSPGLGWTSGTQLIPPGV
ncbi:MAG: hypothetical protein V4438_02505 [Patescibacteria group bacterium]